MKRWRLFGPWMSLVAGVTLGLAGCGDGLRGGSGSGSSAGAVAGTVAGASTGARSSLPQQPPGGAWYKGDLHSHTTYSGDAKRQGGDSPAACVRIAEHVGLDFLNVSDHRGYDIGSDPSYVSNRIVLFAGEEWGSTAHVVLLGIHAQVPEIDSSQPATTFNAQVQAAIDETHRQGGLFIPAHPLHRKKLWIWDVRHYDAIEVWNQPWSFRRWQDATPADLDGKLQGTFGGQPIPAHPMLPTAVLAQGGGENYDGLIWWEEHLNARIKIGMVGGGDRHMLFPPGRPTTRVYASSRDPRGILEGIRMGRTYVTRGPEGPEVSFTADADANGTYESMVGSTIPLGGPIRFRAQVVGADGGTLEVIRNGTSIVSVPIQGAVFHYDFVEQPTAYTWYRVDVYEPLNPNAPGAAALAGPNGQVQSLFDLIRLLPGSLDWSMRTTLPLFTPPDDLDRILNQDLHRRTWCRSAMTSAVFVE